MGTRRVQAISDLLICRLYIDGLGRTEIGWRAHLCDKEVCDILKANGVPLRSHAESAAMARARRLRREQRHIG